MKKQTAINLISQITAFVINFGISFFLTPYIIENIGVEANGFVTLANNFVDYAHLFIVAINSMAGRFITIKIHQKNTEDANKYFTSVVFANIAFSVIFTVIFAVAIVYLDKFLNITASSVSDIKILWAFIALNFIVSLFGSIYSVSTFVTDRLDKTAITSMRGSIIRVLVLVICYNFFRPYTFYVGIATLLAGLNFTLSHIRYKKKLMPELRARKKYFDFGCIKELVASGIWNSINKLSGILASGLDLLVTNIFVNGVAMGVLNLSKTVSNIILSLFATVSSIFAPQLTIAYANGDLAEMKKQLIFSIKLMGLLSSIPIAVLMGFGKVFYQLWVPTQNAELLQLLTVIACFNLIFALPLEPLYNIFTVCNKIKGSSIALICFASASILTVFIGLNFIEGEDSSIIYIALVGAFYNTVRVLTFLPIYGAKCLKFKLGTFYPAILRNFLSVIILLVISFAINSVFDINTWAKLIVSCIVVAIIGLVTNALSIFNKEELREARNVIMRFIRKKGD